MILYRAVSDDEYKDYNTHNIFRTGKNTLEAKQFFKSEIGVLEFVKLAIKRSLRPPYKHIFAIDFDNQCFEPREFATQNLDGYEAITIQQEDLPSFNNCITFMKAQNV